MKRIAELKDTIESLADEAQALNNLAEAESREFTDEEQASWDAIMNEGGSLDQANEALKKAEKLEAERERLSLARKASLNSTQQFQGVSIEGNGNTQANALPATYNRVGKLKAFKGENAERDAYDSGQFMMALMGILSGNPSEQAEKRCLSRGWDVRATATEGTASAGGYLVPTPLSNAIIDVRDSAGVSRRLSRVVPMTSETLDIAKKTAGTTVYYPGEAASITASDQTWGQVSLSAKKRAILSYVSQELNDDSIIAVMDDLASQMGLDLAINEDLEFIKGDGTGTYGSVTGLANAIGAAGINDATTGSDTWAELALVDFTDTMGLLPSKYWGAGVHWLCSSQFYYSVMLNLLADAGGNTVANIEAGNGASPMFLGAPVHFSSQAETASAASTIACYFGAFSHGVMIGDRGGVRIAQSDQFAFDTDRLAIRATTRYDINVHDVGDGSNAGAVVALKTAS